MANRMSIGVVTYLGRYERFFRPLVRQLVRLFPDYDLCVFVNGHHDAARQAAYLREVTAFLSRYPSVRYVTNADHQPLARGWNRLVMTARRERVLILNDDLALRPRFRHNLERVREWPVVCTINDSWSHFVISREAIRRVGWFDERFAGVGDEDVDYICRLAMHGIEIRSVHVPGVHNYVADQRDPGWATISPVVDGKYARLNRDVFRAKWYHSAFEEVPPEKAFRVRYGARDDVAALKEPADAMPEWYPPEALDAPPDGPPPRRTALRAKLLAAADCHAHAAGRRLRGALKRLGLRRGHLEGLGILKPRGEAGKP